MSFPFSNMPLDQSLTQMNSTFSSPPFLPSQGPSMWSLFNQRQYSLLSPPQFSTSLASLGPMTDIATNPTIANTMAVWLQVQNQPSLLDCLQMPQQPFSTYLASANPMRSQTFLPISNTMTVWNQHLESTQAPRALHPILVSSPQFISNNLEQIGPETDSATNTVVQAVLNPTVAPSSPKTTAKPQRKKKKKANAATQETPPASPVASTPSEKINLLKDHSGLIKDFLERFIKQKNPTVEHVLNHFRSYNNPNTALFTVKNLALFCNKFTHQFIDIYQKKDRLTDKEILAFISYSSKIYPQTWSDTETVTILSFIATKKPSSPQELISELLSLHPIYKESEINTVLTQLKINLKQEPTLLQPLLEKVANASEQTNKTIFDFFKNFEPGPAV